MEALLLAQLAKIMSESVYEGALWPEICGIKCIRGNLYVNSNEK